MPLCYIAYVSGERAMKMFSSLLRIAPGILEFLSQLTASKGWCDITFSQCVKEQEPSRDRWVTYLVLLKLKHGIKKSAFFVVVLTSKK